MTRPGPMEVLLSVSLLARQKYGRELASQPAQWMFQVDLHWSVLRNTDKKSPLYAHGNLVVLRDGKPVGFCGIGGWLFLSGMELEFLRALNVALACWPEQAVSP